MSICPHAECRTNFRPRSRRQVYCSTYCREAARRRSGKPGEGEAKRVATQVERNERARWEREMETLAFLRQVARKVKTFRPLKAGEMATAHERNGQEKEA